MPTLDWIGKKAVLNHHREVPYHLLNFKEHSKRFPQAIQRKAFAGSSWHEARRGCQTMWRPASGITRSAAVEKHTRYSRNCDSLLDSLYEYALVWNYSSSKP